MQKNEVGNQGISYSNWALKFAASVSWRVLAFYDDDEDGNDHLSPEQQQSAEKAYETWRRFMLGEIPHPGEYQQHILLLDAIESHTAPKLSPFINRYFLSAIDMDVVSSTDYAFVYSKIFRVVIFGFLHGIEHKKWRGTKINANAGVIGGCDYVLPGEIVTYMNDKANTVFEAQSKLSQKQKDKIGNLFSKHPDKIAASEIFRAMKYDYIHSGEKAFNKDED